LQKLDNLKDFCVLNYMNAKKFDKHAYIGILEDFSCVIINKRHNVIYTCKIGVFEDFLCYTT